MNKTHHLREVVTGITLFLTGCCLRQETRIPIPSRIYQVTCTPTVVDTVYAATYEYDAHYLTLYGTELYVPVHRVSNSCVVKLLRAAKHPT